MLNVYATLARIQRKSKNPWEAKLWGYLRAHRFYGFQFKRQVPIGNFIVDFCCRKKNLILELDGGQHNEDRNINMDSERDLFLKREGYTVLRFWNNEIDSNLQGVLERIRRYLVDDPSPDLSPQEERGDGLKN